MYKKSESSYTVNMYTDLLLWHLNAFRYTDVGEGDFLFKASIRMGEKAD